VPVCGLTVIEPSEHLPSPGSAPAAAPARAALVLGASGYVGSHLVPKLLQAGLPVRAAARSVEPLERQHWKNVELVPADVLDRDTLRAAMSGIGTVYYLVHLMGYGRDLRELERAAALNVAAAAADCGVQRIVYLGALSPPDPESDHIRARHETGEILRAGTVPVTEVRAGIIVGPGSAAFEVMRDLVLNLPVMLTPRWVQAKSPPIALDNLLEYLLRLPPLDEDRHAIYDVGGPEIITYEQKMRSLARLAGKRAPLIVPVPVLTPRLSSYWLWLVTSVPTNVARALIEGLRHDFVANDAEARRRVPQRLATFEEAVEATFLAERERSGARHWREGDFDLRGQRHDHAYYSKQASGAAIGDVPAEAVWEQVAGIGGDNGYYYLDWLWRVRELMDGLIGGGGLARGRAHPKDVRIGDRVDTWEVIGVEPGKRLTMRFGMKAPGAGGLAFVVQPITPTRTRVTATAFWHPKGVAGLAYWWAFAPAHVIVFDGMTKEILRRAAAASRLPPPAS
jgi:uncharacterized protein YbjT (DUF2867 family)